MQVSELKVMVFEATQVEPEMIRPHSCAVFVSKDPTLNEVLLEVFNSSYSISFKSDPDAAGCTLRKYKRGTTMFRKQIHQITFMMGYNGNPEDSHLRHVMELNGLLLEP